MTRGLSTLIVAAFAAGALVTGCGSSTSSKSTSTPAAASAGTSSTGAGTSSTGAGTSSSGAAPTPSATGAAASSPAIQAAVAACKQSIQAQPTLSASVKTKLGDICQKAASGDATAVKQATQQVCSEIVKASNIPAGAALDQAVAACKAR
jgi:hypothetical protein